MAPEVIKGTQLSTGWMKADVWSLGCTVVEMLTGALPFSEYENPMTAMYQIASGKSPPIGSHISVSDNVKSFIVACCAVDPLQRLSAEELLLHPFVNQSWSDDHTLIIIPDSDDPDLPSINEDRDSPSPQKPSPSPQQDLESKKTGAAEQTFKSRIPVLQSRGMKVHVDSPDLHKKSLDEQATPSIYKIRKIREPAAANNFSPNNFQPSIITPTPPTSERTNSSAKFRKQTSRGSAPTNESDSNLSTTPANVLGSPIHHFSDHELSPVNQEHMNTTSDLLRDSSVPDLLPAVFSNSVVGKQHIEGLTAEQSQPSLEHKESIESQGIEESLNYTYSEEFFDSQECDTVAATSLSKLENKLEHLPSPNNLVYGNDDNIQIPISSNSKTPKKELRFDPSTAPNREKPDLLDDSDDNVQALLINGSLMNSKGSIIQV